MGDEVATLLGFLEYQRATLAWKSLALCRRGHPDQLFTLWQDTVARSRSLVTEALATAARSGWPDAPGPMVGHRACGGSWST